ncbi:hypothetical protein [Methanothermobacter wolfeii]|uniref:hypothetical protein n=1 Tax=Methanothermobacter wolfeii TaxID=145261 RepID=UPI0024B32A69|nr:hypothetical protein [Methanothermobacter wolfeii]MDI6701882.1 hypothetical protein [Methanothermobacter wolfeii]MDI6841327.1 hypothetical protein [Methanothermobacter wolfeii]
MDLLKIKGIGSIMERNYERLLVVLPAVFAFLFALVPSLKYSIPLPWDIYYHIHNAMIYMDHGTVFWDPITCAPHGRPIYYPPLFHMLLLLIVKITGISFFTVSRFIQPVMAFMIILSFSYVAERLYGGLTGFLTGVFSISSLFFLRMIYPIPESLAVIILPLTVYGYCRSMDPDSGAFPIITGFFLGLMMLTHPLSASITLAVILISTGVLWVSGRGINGRNVIIIMGTGFLLSAAWYLPLIIKYGFIFRSPDSVPLNLKDYPAYFGSLLTVLATTGFAFAITRRDKRDIIMLVWALFVLLLSFGYLLGLKVLSNRILYFALFPVATMAGTVFNSMKIMNKRWLVYLMVFLLTFFFLSGGYKVAASAKPMVSETELDVSRWFKYNGDHVTVVASDYHIQPAVVAVSRQPVSAGGYAPGSGRTINVNKYIGTFNYTGEDIKRDRVGYIILAHDTRTPPYSRMVYRNRDFVVYRVLISGT